MKLGFILPAVCFAGKGGVPVQARMWKEGLENNGNQVEMISPWGEYEWESFDYIVVFGIGSLLLGYVRLLRQYPKIKLVSAPIIDFPKSLKEFRFRAKYFGSVKYKVNRPLHDLYYARNMFDFFLARSVHEKKYIVDGLGVDSSKVEIVPLSMRFTESIPNVDLATKENFCLHVSRLSYWGKNVARLIEAAKKYHFQLKLAGSLFGEGDKEWLDGLIKDAPNIEYVGFLSEEELKNYYKRAKVFALPSIVEGVGFVALEAAVYGAEIVLTDIGAPKEYYNGRAFLVSPYDVDAIGNAVIKAMNEGKSQPELKDYILNNYSFDVLSKKLHDVLAIRLS